MRIKRPSSVPSSATGAAMLEFALAVPILFLFLFGIIDLANIFTTRSILDGAIYLAGKEAARMPEESVSICRSNAEKIFRQKASGYAGFGIARSHTVTFDYKTADSVSNRRILRATLQADIRCMLLCGLLQAQQHISGTDSTQSYNFTARYDFPIEDQTRCRNP